MAPQIDPTVQYGVLGVLVLVVSWLIKALHDQTSFMHKLIDKLMGKIDDSNKVSTETAMAIQGVTDALRENTERATREHTELNRGFEVYRQNPNTAGCSEDGQERVNND